MEKVAKFVLNSILDQPKKLAIAKKEENGLLTLTVNVAPEEIGKVIGKNGRTIKALTALVRIKAIKEGQKINLEIQEKGS